MVKAALFLSLLLLSFSGFAQLDHYTYYQHQSRIYFDQDRFKDAEAYADSVLTLAIRSTIPDSIAHAYFWLYKIHAARKQYQKALDDFTSGQSYQNTVDSTLKVLGETQWADQQKKEKEAYDNETARLQSEISELKKLNDQDRRNAITIFFGFVALTIIGLFFLFRRNAQLERLVEKSKGDVLEVQDFKIKLFEVLSGELDRSISTLQRNLENQSSVSEETHHATRNLNEVVRHVIHWLSYQAHVKPLNPVEFNCKALVEDVLKGFQSQLEARQITVDNFIPNGQSAYADREMISIAMENLISNATRFTGDGGKISFFSGSKEDLVTLGIKDTGIGINEEGIRSLFSLNKDAGTEKGIGLVLSKDLVERNGGMLYVESVVGEGSTFYFSLPGKKLTGD